MHALRVISWITSAMEPYQITFHTHLYHLILSRLCEIILLVVNQPRAHLLCCLFLASYHEVAGPLPPPYSHEHNSVTPKGYQAPQQHGANPPQFSGSQRPQNRTTQPVRPTRSNPTHSSQQAVSGTVRKLI